MGQKDIARHARHALVGNNNSNTGVTAQALKPFLPRGSGQDRVGTFQQVGQCDQNFRLVIHNEHKRALCWFI